MIYTSMSHMTDIASTGYLQMEEKRAGMGPIPSEPERYINAQQVHGMTVLKLFGWNIVCIRRPIDSPPITIMMNREENALGILEQDGSLRLSGDIKVRNTHFQGAITVKSLMDRLQRIYRN